MTKTEWKHGDRARVHYLDPEPGDTSLGTIYEHSRSPEFWLFVPDGRLMVDGHTVHRDRLRKP